LLILSKEKFLVLGLWITFPWTVRTATQDEGVECNLRLFLQWMKNILS